MEFKNYPLKPGQFVDEAQKKSLIATSYLMATNPDVIAHIAAADTPWLQNYAKEVMKETGLESITISDKQGNVIARGHSPKVGDSVLKQVNVQQALKGEITVGVESGTIVKFSLRSGYPVKRGGEIVGVITPGFTLSTDRFVERIGTLAARPEAGIEGLHLFTFNQVEVVETWRRRMLASLGAGG